MAGRAGAKGVAVARDAGDSYRRGLPSPVCEPGTIAAESEFQRPQQN